MTVKDAAKAYQQIDYEKRSAEAAREILKPRCNALLASIVGESRKHNLEPDDFRKILSALLKHTKFEGVEIKDDGANYTLSGYLLASDVYELGSPQLSYNVWFEKYRTSGGIELHFSQVVGGK